MPNTDVVITGCSTGIGRACALRFAERGLHVLATARNLESLADLPKIHPLIQCATLDVTNPDQCREVIQGAGSFKILVNNAGYGVMGPLEEISEAELRKQFDVNVFAVMRLTQLALPMLRRSGGGTIVQVGSVVGKFSYPLGGAYCATKHALEALCDAQRVEVRQFGIRLILIEPGPIETEFKSNARKASDPVVTNANSPYLGANTIASRILNDNRGGMKGASPDRVARIIVQAALSKSPRARYVVTARGLFMILMRRCLPDFLWDYLLAKGLGLK